MNPAKWLKASIAGVLALLFSAGLNAATIQEIESALRATRRDLRISIAAEKRIASDLEKIKQSQNVSPDIIEDYERYLSRVHAMVVENLDTLAKLDALHARYDTDNSSERPANQNDTESIADPEIPEEQMVDEVAALDRELERSLIEFDEMLLKELDLITAKSSERMQDLAKEVAAAAERLREKGIDVSPTSGEGPVASEQEPNIDEKTAEREAGDFETGKQDESLKERDEGEAVARDESREGAEGSLRHPKNRYDPRNDDIVARQLREAAENEKDPELREKLWKEYEKYKTDTRQ